MRLIDADALLKALDCDPDSCGECKHDHDCGKHLIYTRNDICLTIQESPTVGEWISVKDRLPESAGQMVLVTAHNSYYDTDDVFPAFLAYGSIVWCTYDTIRMQKVTPTDNRVSDRLTITHWMPLPEPPKEVEQG